jgi:hypothetical protein
MIITLPAVVNFVVHTAVPQLLANLSASDLFERHGSALMLAAALSGLSARTDPTLPTNAAAASSEIGLAERVQISAPLPLSLALQHAIVKATTQLPKQQFYDGRAGGKLVIEGPATAPSPSLTPPALTIAIAIIHPSLLTSSSPHHLFSRL